MKKILFVILALIVCPFTVKALSAEAAIVMDADSGRVLYSKNLNKEKLIASTTKIMTCLVAIEHADLNKTITVDERVLKAYGSAIYIEIGEEITMLDLLYGLMLRSGNDAAIVIANEVMGSMTNFAKLMNAKAKEIGMENTMFYNSHGLEETNGNANKSTVYDMALLTKVAMHNQTFRTIFGTKKWIAKSSYKTYVWYNKNRLLSSYEFTTGGKTGYTELAKRTLVTTASKDNKNLIVVTLNDGNDFANHKALYEEYFKKYELANILNRKNFAVVDDKYYKNEKLVIKNDFNILLADNELEEVKTIVELNKIKNLRDNDKVGVVNVYLNDKLIHEESIYIIKENEKVKSSFWQKIWDFIKFWE